MSLHNTFDISEKDGVFTATSHNFKGIKGEADSEEKAIDNLNRAIIAYSDNYPLEFKKNIKDRMKEGLQCGCGLKLEEPALKIYKGAR